MFRKIGLKGTGGTGVQGGPGGAQGGARGGPEGVGRLMSHVPWISVQSGWRNIPLGDPFFMILGGEFAHGIVKY